MKTNIDITSHVSEETGWLFAIEDGGEDFETLAGLTEERIAQMCKDWGVSPDFLIEVNAQFETLREAMHSDLADIWKRLDSLEG